MAFVGDHPPGASESQAIDYPGEEITAMTVTALPTAGRNSAVPGAHLTGLANSRHHGTNASGLVHEATAPLLAALEGSVAAAAAQGINDTGARTTAAALRDARIALDFAIIAAARALADREVHIPVGPATETMIAS